MKLILENSKLIVIKIGSVLVRGDALDQANQPWMNALAQDIRTLRDQGKKIVLVSSGGVALGRKALNIASDISPSSIPLAKKQAASAVGQYHLFNGYFKAFEKQSIIAAQVLLTISETENRRMNLNARETLHTLLESGIVPIINENDTVSTEEIRFGDNDRLSVRVAQMILADTVVVLSTTDGLYTDNPDINPQAEHIPFIDGLTDEHTKMAGDAIAGLSTGGMKSKIEAASAATKSSINLIITDGQDNHALSNLYDDPAKKSTLFAAQKCDNNARKIWLGAHMNPKGSVTIDDGALSALNSGKSLLPVGVKGVSGNFKRGDVIEIKTLSGDKIGMGISAYNADDARRIIGINSAKIHEILGYIGRTELVHRNDMVLET
ncbi:MAG: glutamate 5-kinase [Alphaproteobacteria bacterium]|nr:MAG: glutamate 5-kinase [Alphaproteobacteria bacterium]